MPAPNGLRLSARAAAQARDTAAAARLWAQLLDAAPGDPEAANALGNLALAEGEAERARGLFETALSRDPRQPALLFNLSAACRAAGDLGAALAALDGALAIDPYMVQALFQKAVLLEDAGRAGEAARIYRDFLDTAPPEVQQEPRFAHVLERARAAVRSDDAALGGLIGGIGAPPSRRVAAGLAHLTGKAPIYRSEPTFLTVPELPAAPFLDRALVPWLPALEQAWETIRDEAVAFGAGVEAFVPYVANPPGTPLNQWAGLDHNRDWGALFLWRHGVRNEQACARMPGTVETLASLPLLELQGRAPNAFVSRLAPRTRIPPHNGVTNARVTVHLPLVVPPGCAFRVGPETRAWVPGQAWVFDDTIEHEAWNDSGEPRLILIFDVWHPLLEPAERGHLAAALRAYDRHYGRPVLAGNEL